MSAPLAPQPIASTLGQWFFSVEGVTGSVFTLGAAMFLSSLVVIGSVLRARRRSANAGVPTVPRAPESEPA
jgi:hypothetical protein